MKGIRHGSAAEPWRADWNELPFQRRRYTSDLVLVGLFLVSLARTGAGPVWEKPSLFLGSLDLDGGLRQRFELGVLSGSPEFALPVFLEHGFRAEDPVTEYKIPQLESYVVPEGRDQILWFEPGGIRHYFKTTAILAKAPAKPKEPCLAIQAGAGIPKSIVATEDKGKTITDCHYVWSPSGKLETRTLNGVHHQYRYDPLGRLTEVVKTNL